MLLDTDPKFLDIAEAIAAILRRLPRDYMGSFELGVEITKAMLAGKIPHVTVDGIVKEK